MVLALHLWMLRQTDRLHPADKPSPYGCPCSQCLAVTFLVATAVVRHRTAELWRTSGQAWSCWQCHRCLMLLVTWAGAVTVKPRAALCLAVNPHAAAYYWVAALPLALMVFAGALVAALVSSGHTDPLPYIPLLNPTDLTLALALGALMFWRRVLVSAVPAPARAGWVTGRKALVALALLVFVVINTVWLRVAHHFFGVSWEAEALFGSFVVQTGLPSLWTLLALIMWCWQTAARSGRCGWWVLAFWALSWSSCCLIDLSNAGGASESLPS